MKRVRVGHVESCSRTAADRRWLKQPSDGVKQEASHTEGGKVRGGEDKKLTRATKERGK
jgi:hypothetical protein